MRATWRCRTASLAIEGTGGRGQEHRQGQAAGWDQGRWVAGVARVETKKKRNRDDGRRICSATAQKNNADLSRSRLPGRDNGIWTSNRQIKRRPPHDVCQGGFRRLGGWGKGRGRCPDGARQCRRCRSCALVACHASEPMEAHNLVKTRTAMVRVVQVARYEIL